MLRFSLQAATLSQRVGIIADRVLRKGKPPTRRLVLESKKGADILALPNMSSLFEEVDSRQLLSGDEGASVSEDLVSLKECLNFNEAFISSFDSSTSKDGSRLFYID